MSDRTDEQRVLTGQPVDIERGRTPGAVAKLRAELRESARDLLDITQWIMAKEALIEAKRAELQIRRDACDELIDAIISLGGEVR